ncbi:Serine/threonine-protein kinase VRK1 [Labeo rohita]|uniref:non-specific serine/threonine protein kinase n=1 Tax=Labeo rohita TaxID=84645 RepID=A0ABQ8LW90_LABRO|nr:Serine/threonine-protein kinase VRK1 [Labeo rohita]
MPPKSKADGAKKARAPPKRKLAEEFPPGEVLIDNGKKKWKLGSAVGQGGFGLLYLANEDSSGSEPSDNGPLFSELKFYMRAAKPDLIGAWMKSRKMDYLGVPKYWGSGFHEKGGKRYRFMVMDRFGMDLQKKFEGNGKKFPRKLVLQLGLRLLDILEYIHDHEYVHADIKASNLLLSYTNPNQVYLVDYGLAYRYSPEGVPKEYKEDPKRCHDGTIEFTSIDAHKGVSPSRRGDLEIMGYCMIQWLCGRLPWEDKLQDPLYVRDSKLRCRDNIDEFLKSCFPSENKPVADVMAVLKPCDSRAADGEIPPQAVVLCVHAASQHREEMKKFMQEVKALGYTDKPDYAKLRGILQQGLKTIGASDDKKLDFGVSTNGTSPPSVKRPGVYPSGPSSSSHRQVLSACVYSLLMYHKFADTVTLESARAGNQRAALTTGEGTDSPRFPQCSLHMEAQQGLDGNHEAAIGKMEGKCEGVWGGLTPKRKKAEEKGQSADETDGAPAKKRRAPQKKEEKGAKKTASPAKRPAKKEAQASSEPAVKKTRGRPKKNS